MKIILLFLICFNLNAETVIEVLEGQKLIAGDSGANVTVESLRQKMLSKNGIDINDQKYSISVKNEQSNAQKDKIVKDALKDIRKMDCALQSDSFLKNVCLFLQSKR